MYFDSDGQYWTVTRIKCRLKNVPPQTWTSFGYHFRIYISSHFSRQTLLSKHQPENEFLVSRKYRSRFIVGVELTESQIHVPSKSRSMPSNGHQLFSFLIKSVFWKLSAYIGLIYIYCVLLFLEDENTCAMPNTVIEFHVLVRTPCIASYAMCSRYANRTREKKKKKKNLFAEV